MLKYKQFLIHRGKGC